MEFFENLKETIENLWMLLVRPNRISYEMPHEKSRTRGGFDENPKVLVTNFLARNVFGENVNCYRYEKTDQKCKRVLIYCHTHSGSALEGSFLTQSFLGRGFDFICFDFSGSGKSEGKYVTLGYKEKEDLKVIVKQCRDVFGYSEIFLWGRSMGAATIILLLSCHQELQKNIVGVVLDSPFGNLRKMCVNMARQTTSLPKFIINPALSSIRKKVIEMANFDLDKINPEERVGAILVPAVFLLGKEDAVVSLKTIKRLFEGYSGKKKELMIIEGEHGTTRSGYDIYKAIDAIKKLVGDQEISPESAGISIGTKIDSLKQRHKGSAEFIQTQKETRSPFEDGFDPQGLSSFDFQRKLQEKTNRICPGKQKEENIESDCQDSFSFPKKQENRPFHPKNRDSPRKLQDHFQKTASISLKGVLSTPKKSQAFPLNEKSQSQKVVSPNRDLNREALPKHKETEVHSASLYVSAVYQSTPTKEDGIEPEVILNKSQIHPHRNKSTGNHAMTPPSKPLGFNSVQKQSHNYMRIEDNWGSEKPERKNAETTKAKKQKIFEGLANQKLPESLVFPQNQSLSKYGSYGATYKSESRSPIYQNQQDPLSENNLHLARLVPVQENTQEKREATRAPTTFSSGFNQLQEFHSNQREANAPKTLAIFSKSAQGSPVYSLDSKPNHMKNIVRSNGGPIASCGGPIYVEGGVQLNFSRNKKKLC